jgi:S1/P1 nuclease
MFKRSVLLLAAVVSMLVTLFLPATIFAWGNTGHEAVAHVAWQQMKTTARAKAMDLLKQVPQLTTPSGKKVDGFSQWRSQLPPGLSADDQNLFLFMRAATWADSIKHVGFHDSDDPPSGVSVDHPIGFTDSASHGYWHFIDNGLTSDNSTVLPAPVPNVAVQIVELRKDLASDTDPKLRAYELAWLLHLYGDIHQPLHGARRFVAGKSDLGGNSVKISLSTELRDKFLANRPQGAPGNPPAELHAFWDDLPGVTSDPSLALKPAADFAKGLATANSTDVNVSDPEKWSDRSFQLAKQDGYVSPVGPGNKDKKGRPFAMTTGYYNTALVDGKAQIALAGARLAKMLNDLWPEPGSTKKK